MVIAARDRDRDALGEGSGIGNTRVIGGDDAVGQRDRFASSEEVEVDVGAVAPAAVADHEAVDQGSDIGRLEVEVEAAAARPGDAGVGFADGDDIGGIELTEGEAAGCGERSGAITLDEITPGGDGIDHRLVIAARDRDRDRLIDVAALVIGDADREEVRDRFPGGQVLNNRAGAVGAVVQRVGPGAAVALESERAVAAGAGARDAPGGMGPGIDVAGAQRACSAEGAVFCDGA